MLKIFYATLLAALLLGCSQTHQANANNSAQSATAVTAQSSNLTLTPLSAPDGKVTPNLRKVADVYASKTSHVQVEDSGAVVKVLADDNNGLRHQKFLVKTNSGQTLLFAHNIDLAARIANIKAGDAVQFRGEYIYNPKGGIVHWTHKDPAGRHYAGWIKHNGNTYD